MPTDGKQQSRRTTNCSHQCSANRSTLLALTPTRQSKSASSSPTASTARSISKSTGSTPAQPSNRALAHTAKHSSHVTSKRRFQSAQLIAYLTENQWLGLAAHSNQQMDRLVASLVDAGVKFLNPPDRSGPDRRARVPSRSSMRGSVRCFLLRMS
jgi:hypothetical protein